MQRQHLMQQQLRNMLGLRGPATDMLTHGLPHPGAGIGRVYNSMKHCKHCICGTAHTCVSISAGLSRPTTKQ
jgi:hypothetical protein